MKRISIVKGQRENYFVIIFGFILVVIVIAIGIILLTASKQPATPTVTITPTSSVPSITVPNAYTYSPLKYNAVAARRLFTREVQPTPLSSSDAQAKTRILQSLSTTGPNAGIIYTSNTIIIHYVPALDLFKVEVLTIDVPTAKADAETWFKQQGMSQQGICDLPLGFFPNWKVANFLKQSNYEFNELPDGC